MQPVEAELAALAARPADRASLDRVRALCAEDRVRTGAARLHAAAVLVASADRTDVERAHELALQAMAEQAAARPVAACAFDRLRVLAGAPQKFGTQRRQDGSPWPIDARTTDSERAKWGLPGRAVLEAGGWSLQLPAPEPEGGRP